MFVLDRPLQPSVMSVGKVRSLTQSEAPKRYYLTYVGCAILANIIPGWKGINTLDYYKRS